MPCASSCREKPAGIADAGDGVHGFAGEVAQRPRRAAAERHRVVDARIHRKFARPAVAVGNDNPGAVERAGRLAQRPGRETPAVSEAAFAVDYHDVEVAAQREVLKTIVADNNVATMRVDEHLRAAHAIRPDYHRHPAAAENQDRLVADFGGGGGFIHLARPASGAPAIPARDYSRRHSPAFQVLNQLDQQRGFAGAANADIADYDQRQRQFVAF